MKIVFLVINYMQHQLVSIKAVIQGYNAEVYAFNHKDAHTIPKGIGNLKTYQSKDFTKPALLNKILEIKPQIVVVAGWAVKEYVWVAKQIRKQLNIPVVSYSDTHWRSTWKQKANCLISFLHLKRAFSHIWVAGVFQYEYARKLGFAKSKIIYNSLSCDMELFDKVSLRQKQNKYPRNFLFVGRFVTVKGLDLLLAAWEQIPDKKDWKLTLIGDGPLKEQFKTIEGVIVEEFMPQNRLIKEIESAGCFVLPSVFEQWSLVINEAAAAGLPVIATSVCGASPHFIINGYNGYIIEPNTKSIQEALQSIIDMDEERLCLFSQNSRKLSKNITPELGAAQLMSVLATN